MAYMSLIADCLRCGRMFAANAGLVPNIKGKPLCRECIELLQAQRLEQGLEPWFIHPEAYEPEEVM